VLGGTVFVLASLIGGLVLIRNKPEDMGQLPDGVSSDSFIPAVTVENNAEGGMGRKGWGAGWILRVPATWLIGSFNGAGAFAMGTMSAHQVAYLEDSGYTPMTAAMTMSMLAISVVIGSLGFGALALRFNIRYLASIFFAIQFIAMGILLATKNLTFIYIYAILLGVGHGGINTSVPTFIGAYYGRDHYAQVIGIILPFQVFVQAVSAIIAGAIYDTTATYIPAFIASAALSVAGLILAFLTRQPKLPQPNGWRLPVR
jgi:MFS family permease